MQILTFSVQGSSEEPYEVIFYFVDEKLSGSCTFSAGNNGKYCKHRVNILNEETTAIVNRNDNDVATVISWYKGSELKNAYDELSKIKKEIEKLKSKQKKSENELTRIFNR